MKFYVPFFFSDRTAQHVGSQFPDQESNLCPCSGSMESFLKNKFIIYLFLAALGLHCCTQAFSSCSEWGLLFVAVCRILIAVASLVPEHGLQACGLQELWHTGLSSCVSRALERRLSSCGTRAQLLRSMWDLSGPGLKPVSPALAGGFLTTAPPGKSLRYLLYH